MLLQSTIFTLLRFLTHMCMCELTCLKAIILPWGSSLPFSLAMCCRVAMAFSVRPVTRSKRRLSGIHCVTQKNFRGDLDLITFYCVALSQSSMYLQSRPKQILPMASRTGRAATSSRDLALSTWPTGPQSQSQQTRIPDAHGKVEILIYSTFEHYEMLNKC